VACDPIDLGFRDPIHRFVILSPPRDRDHQQSL
jgi:hypothetical protein